MNKFLKYALSIVLCLSTGAVGTIFTVSAIPTWYTTLVKPSFSPPNWIFGPVWTTLYILMGISLATIWEKGINWRKWWMWAFAWNIVPALKVAYMGYRYLIQQEVSYQSAQLFSADWSIINIPIRMFRFVYDGLLFWNWSEDWLGPFSEGCTSTMVNKISIPLIIGVVGFAVAIFLINKFQSSEGKIPVNKILLFATIFSILAYLPFLPLGQIHPFFKISSLR